MKRELTAREIADQVYATAELLGQAARTLHEVAADLQTAAINSREMFRLPKSEAIRGT